MWVIVVTIFLQTNLIVTPVGASWAIAPDEATCKAKAVEQTLVKIPKPEGVAAAWQVGECKFVPLP